MTPFDDMFADVSRTLTLSRQQAHQAIQASMVQMYWEIGRMLAQRKAQGMPLEEDSGELCDLARSLARECGRAFSVHTLLQMHTFHTLSPNAKALSPQLSWAHYRLLMKVANPQARQWYLRRATALCWSSAQLAQSISTRQYENARERVADKGSSRESESLAAQSAAREAEDPGWDVHVLGFLGLSRPKPEGDLKKALVGRVQDYLLGLGLERGFCLVARQKTMRCRGREFCPDLVFYHRLLRCHVLVEVEIDADREDATHHGVDRLGMQMKLMDILHRKDDERQTMGMLLCSQAHGACARYVLPESEQAAIASLYATVLPTTEALCQMLARERRLVEDLSEQE